MSFESEQTSAVPVQLPASPPLSLVVAVSSTFESLGESAAPVSVLDSETFVSVDESVGGGVEVSEVLEHAQSARRAAGRKGDRILQV